MVRITIDTEKDSHHTIQKIISLLQQFASGHAPVQMNASMQNNASVAKHQPSYQPSYQEGTPAGTTGYTDMFAELPTSEPVQPKNVYEDLFAPKQQYSDQLSEQKSAPEQNTTANFFGMPSASLSSTAESEPVSSVSSSPSADGLFDMFSDQTNSPSTSSVTMADMFAPNPTPSTTLNQDDNSQFSDIDFPNVLDDYAEEKKEEFSAKDYLKVQEYDE
ncbi:hypothetical protein K9M74_03605 [Candidatus Woesearchaeota archaeon]|nr:hypothetical protein [Candidatus Woesearchaeota archaeon]